MMQAVVDTLVNQLNMAGAAGFSIPTMDGVTLVNPEIVWDVGAVRIDTDIKYSP
jgi:hypothetical protein